MLGCMLTTRCIGDLTAAQYGTFFMCVISAGDCEDWSCKRFRAGSMGTGTALQSMRLNLVRMALVYDFCDSDIVCTSSCASPASQVVSLWV